MNILIPQAISPSVYPLRVHGDFDMDSKAKCRTNNPALGIFTNLLRGRFYQGKNGKRPL